MNYQLFVVPLQPKGERMAVPSDILHKKQLLAERLYEDGYLWSYQPIGNGFALSDEELIMKGLAHLEFEDMHLLFETFPYRQIKSVWQQRMLPYSDYYGTLNMLLAALFFHIKHPKEYIRHYVA